MSNGNGNTIDVLGPDGVTYGMPLDKVSDAIKAGGVIKGSTTEIQAQALAASGITPGPQLQSAATSPSAIPQPQLQTSMAPSIVRGVGAALPVVGGWGGGILGAGAGGIGAIGGAGVGAMAGEEGRQAINQAFALPTNRPDLNLQLETQPMTAEESARNLALAGGLGAASELGAGLLIGAGGKIIPRIVAAQSARELGSAAAGLAEQTPIGFSKESLQGSLNRAFANVSDRLTTAFQNSAGTTSLSQALDPIVQRAAQSNVTGTASRLNRIITAAKEVAGIQGDQVTAEQMYSFAQEMAKKVYSGNPGPVQAVLQNLQKDAYSHLGGIVRSLAPDAAEPLAQLTNLHAALDAVKRSSLGKLGATYVTAATHPTATAALSPAITIGATQLPGPWETVRRVASEFLP